MNAPWMPDDSKRRIVCAAVKFKDGLIVGPRHYDDVMRAQYHAFGFTATEDDGVQGFIDQFGTFHDRKAAFVIAQRQDQIRHKSGHPDSKELFSEDLY